MKIKDLQKIKKQSEKLEKICAICGRKINLFLYQDRSYRGGHYFGKVSLSVKQGKKVEYWECPKCYWN
jgi:hypothetical protein